LNVQTGSGSLVGLKSDNSGAGSNLKVEGHTPFYCAPALFVVPQGTTEKCSLCRAHVTRTELGQRWPTVRDQSDL